MTHVWGIFRVYCSHWHWLYLQHIPFWYTCKLFWEYSLFTRDFSILSPYSKIGPEHPKFLLLYWFGLLWLKTNSWKLKLIVERRKKITREQVQATKICNTVTWRTGCSELWRQGRGTFQSTTSHPRRTCTWD